MTFSAIRYTGTALPTNSDTFALFDTTTVSSQKFANLFAMAGVKRFIVAIKNSHAGTLKSYKSDDNGSNWNQVDEVSVAAAAATGENVYTFLVAQYRDWKLTWVNGGTTQTTYEIDMSLSDEIAGA